MKIEILSALIGAAAATLLGFLAYLYTEHRANAKSKNKFLAELDNLERHISASINSLAVDPKSPRYVVAARIRFCKFLDIGFSDIQKMDWLTDDEKIMQLKIVIRNSDILMDEISEHIYDMKSDGVAVALADAKKNMNILMDHLQELRT